MHKVALAALAAACLAESGMAANCRAPKVGKMLSLTKKNKETILERHNYERDLLVAAGYADIKYMKWNQDLQLLAENLEGACKFEHSPGDCRSHSPVAPYCGENLAAKSFGKDLDADLYSMVNNWDSEKKDYNAATGKCNPGAVCGHYTQVVWPATEYVGCAVTECQSGVLSMPARMIRCVYGPGGNYNGEKATHKATGKCLEKDICGGPHEGACGLSGGTYHCYCHDGYHNEGGNDKGKCVKQAGGNAGCQNSHGCNDHGSCVSGNCNCNPAWSGKNCETPVKTCNPATTCSGHGKCQGDNKCKCDAGWAGNSCGLKDDKCAGFCKHAPAGACKTTNNVPKCQSCHSGWSGDRCDTPAGGAWNPTGMWTEVVAEVNKLRHNYGKNSLPTRALDRSAAQKEANKCSNTYHSPSEVDGDGNHLWTMMLCLDQGEDKFTFSKWLGESVIGGMAPFATSKWTTAWGCAIADHSCSPKGSACGGKKWRSLACAYHVAKGHVTEKDSLLFADQTTPPTQQAAAGSIAVPVLAAACVALAVVVVVLAIKVRKANQPAEADYTEMVA